MSRMTENVWEPLAEIEFNSCEGENSRSYCLCSRAFIRSRFKGDSWEEILKEKLQNCEMPDEQLISVSDPDGHPVEFQNFKKQEVEAVSCYCSASHYSTDDYESVMQSTLDHQPTVKDQLLPCPLQNSDSGADLSENFTDKPCCMAPENSELSWQYSKSKLETAWEKYWSENGESIIWKSWIEKYGAYINPSYLEQNSLCENLDVDPGNITKEKTTNEGNVQSGTNKENPSSEIPIPAKEKAENCVSGGENLPVLKISSYPSCGNLSETGDTMQTNKFIDESDSEDKIIKSNSFGSYASYEKVKFNDISEEKLRHGDHERVRSRCSNTNLSVKSVANTTVTTDSMTNVTKITLSSLDLSGEECDSVKSSSLLSSCCDDSSGPSSTSSSSSSSSKEEICTEADMWWRKVWKEHYEDQYALSYELFVKNFELSKGQAAETENTCQVKVNKVSEGDERKGKNVFKSRQYLNSVGYILSKLDKTNLCAEENERCESENDENDKMEVLNSPFKRNETLKRHLENSEDSFDEVKEADGECTRRITQIKNQEGEKLQKREKLAKKMDNIKQAMTLMGFSFKPDSQEMLSGYVRYRKRNIRGQNRRLKLFDNKPRTHLFFDDEGNPFQANQSESVEHGLGELCEKPDENLAKLELGNFVECESLGYEAHSSSVEDDNDFVDESKKQKKKRKKQRKYCLPQEIIDNKSLFKYWLRRYQLFSKFDKGIKLDAESWYSVTPEQLAKHHAERCRCDVIVDAFCGAGGNSIQFAFTCERVIAIDKDPVKIEMAKHNAKIYGVEDRIEFIVGDFVKLSSNLQADVVFLSPPWGGPGYNHQDVYGLDSIFPPLGGKGLILLASAITDDVALFLPKNTDSTEIALLSGPGGQVEIEQNFLDRRLRAITAYFGGLITDPDDPYINNT